MEQTLTLDLLDEFENITQFPIADYLQSFDSFIKRDSQNIIGYYSGDLKSLDKSAYSNLLTLIERDQDLFSTISLNKSAFRNYKWWVLIDNLEQANTLLLKFNTISKWLRSAISNSEFNPNPEISIPFNQGQVLEDIQRNVLGSTDWDNTWVETAIKNDLREEDYTSDAGFLLKANFNFTLNNFKINSIVDNPIDTKILGIDLPTKMEIDTTLEDYVVLSPENTFIQTINILINLRKGDNPEFPDQGINPSLVVGSNLNSLSYPTLFRQLTTLFKNDDTIKTFTLVSIRREVDAVFVDFECESRLGDLQKISLTV